MRRQFSVISVLSIISVLSFVYYGAVFAELGLGSLGWAQMPLDFRRWASSVTLLNHLDGWT